MSIRDTTQPSYVSGDSGKHRVLLLELTDGRKVIKAIEHVRIPWLTYDCLACFCMICITLL